MPTPAQPFGSPTNATAGRKDPDDERAVAALGPALDPGDGRVEDGDATAQDVVLERLHVAGANTHERSRIHRQASL